MWYVRGGGRRRRGHAHACKHANAYRLATRTRALLVWERAAAGLLPACTSCPTALPSCKDTDVGSRGWAAQAGARTHARRHSKCCPLGGLLGGSARRWLAVPGGCFQAASRMCSRGFACCEAWPALSALAYYDRAHAPPRVPPLPHCAGHRTKACDPALPVSQQLEYRHHHAFNTL